MSGSGADTALALVSESFLSRFIVGPLLGKGSFGHVYAAKDRQTGTAVALKIMIRSQLGPKGEASVQGEIEVMTALQHPKILKLHTTSYDPKTITLVLDQVVGGEVFQQLLKVRHYTERLACRVMKNLLIGIKYMHDEGIVHRDLKPDNMLLVDDPINGEDIANIKIADFGFATKYRGVPLTQPCGTPYYIAPEILDVGLHKTRPHYGETVDLWSAGVIAYLLIAGYPPFYGSDKTRLFRAISRGAVDFSNAPWKDVSYEAKDFIMRLLQVNPTKRLTAATALEHRWLKNVEASPDAHLPDVQRRLAEFLPRQKLKGAVFGAEAVFRLRYLAKCEARKLKPNTELVEMLTGATKVIRRLDLSNNYLGPNGMATLVEVLAAHSEVEEVVLRNSLIDDDLAHVLLTALALPTSRVWRVELDHNPVTHGTGRRVLAMLQCRRHLSAVTVTGTKISEAIRRKIDAQCAANAARRSTNLSAAVVTAAALRPATHEPASGSPTRPPRPVASSSPARPMSGYTRQVEAVHLPPLVRTVARTTPTAPRFNPSYR